MKPVEHARSEIVSSICDVVWAFMLFENEIRITFIALRQS
jgi:hypothetical protein